MEYIKIFFLIILSFTSCKKETEKPKGSDKAKAIYNHAYQENYQADKIEDIIKEANNAYILIDPFIDNVFESVAKLKENNNEVGAYISIGTGEDYREDFSSMHSYLVSQQWDAWPGEYFVKETNTGIIAIMKARIDKIAAWGCNWVEFDNMDWVFDEDLRTQYGITATEAEGIAYYQELCNYVHQKGMKCMAKNHVIGADDFDGVLYESYHNDKNWWDVNGAQSFLDAGKLVIINHYKESNCDKVYTDYMNKYNSDLSFICEDTKLKKYIHYND